MNRCENYQATSMARFAGIELRPEQINDYVFARNCQDKEFVGECDQILLDMCLDHNQTIIFRKKFNNIFNDRVKLDYGERTPKQSGDNL